MRIALEGGGARSAFSAGVLSAFAERDLPVEAIVGSSSGSINAAFFASGQIERVCELWAEPTFAPYFVNWRRFATPGGKPGIDVDTLIDEIFHKSGELDMTAALASAVRLYFTVTSTDSGKPSAVHPDPIYFWEWMRASMAIPVAYNRIVQINGRGFIDGGVASPIPFDTPLTRRVQGPTIAIITRPITTDKARPAFWQRMLINRFVPEEIRPLILKQHVFHNEVLDRLRRARERGRTFVIAPPDGFPVSRLTRNPRVLGEAVKIGREAGQRFLDEHPELGNSTVS